MSSQSIHINEYAVDSIEVRENGNDVDLIVLDVIENGPGSHHSGHAFVMARPLWQRVADQLAVLGIVAASHDGAVSA